VVLWCYQSEKDERHSDPNLEEKLQQTAKVLNEEKRKSARRKEYEHISFIHLLFYFNFYLQCANTVSWQERLPLHNNFCFKTSWIAVMAVTISGHHIACCTMWATPTCLQQKEGIKSFGLAYKDTQDKDDWRLGGNGTICWPGFTWKIAVKTGYVCVCFFVLLLKCDVMFHGIFIFCVHDIEVPYTISGGNVIVRPLSTFVGYMSVVASVIHSRQWSN